MPGATAEKESGEPAASSAEAYTPTQSLPDGYRSTLLKLGLFVVIGSAASLAYAKLFSLNRRLRAREAEPSALSAKLSEYAEHLRLVIDTIPVYIYAKDANGHFILANKAFAKIFGCKPEEVVGRTNEDYGASHEDMMRYIEEDRTVLKTGKALHIPEEPGPRQDGSPGWFETTKIPYRHPGWTEPAILGVTIDITERRMQSELIRHMAQHESLTGLANRALFMDLFEQSLDLARRERMGLALLFIDLDGFKAINDNYGHAAGDDMLKATADRIRATIRSSDRAGRIGGDEFVAFLHGVRDDATAASVAKKILAALGAPLQSGQDMLAVSASIGVALFPAHADAVAELLRLADEAMYRGKRDGGGKVELAYPPQRSCASVELR